jgi:hypothetical protein
MANPSIAVPSPGRSRDDRILDELKKISARLDRLEESLALVEETSQQAPQLVAVVTDTADYYIRQVQDRGIDIDERLRALMPLLERMTQPRTLKALEEVLEHAPALASAAGALEDVPGLVAMAVDMFDEFVGRQIEAGRDVTSAVRHAIHGTVRLGQFVMSDEFNTLMDSGMLDPNAVRLIGRVGRALSDISQESVRGAGVIRLVGASRTKDFRKSVGFGIRFAERFGQLLQTQIESEAAE